MIHKFEKADANLCTRENVVVLVDEAHRSTGGDLGNYLVGALPKATLIGFTGTPIDKTAYGQGTFKVFGVDDHPKGYLDKYSIADSIADGTTLELHYTLAPNDIRVPHDVLEKEFLSLKETEGISDIEELNRILEKAVTLKAFLKATARVDQVARFIAQHYKENVDPLGYKAFVVGVDRQACALYKEALDRYLPPEWSSVVYTSAHNDTEQLAEHRLSEDEEKKVRKTFAKPDALPKILIVTEKLLTGYDAPILYCMYLDKPMRDHTLLQAIARVNRPYEDGQGLKKPCGMVVDFVGIFEKLEQAVSFDADEVSSVIKNLDVLRARFERLMTDAAPEYLAFAAQEASDKAVEAVIDAFSSKEYRERFFEFFAEVERLYEILSPDVSLRPWVEKYASLCVICRIVRSAFGHKVALIRDLMRKTEELVRTHSVSSGIEGILAPVKLNEETLRAMQKPGGSGPAKVVNLGRGLIYSVQDGAETAPHLLSIATRAEEVLDRFEDRQETTEAALASLNELADEWFHAKAEAEDSGFDTNTFGIFWLLGQRKVVAARDLAPAINHAVSLRPAFRDNPAELRLLKADLYKIMLPVVGKDEMVAVADELLRLSRK
jgi:type I restriction enzyme R subunit